MRLYLLVVGLALSLLACTAEQKKPEKRWDVKVTTSGEPKTWVWRYDGSRQCDTPAQITPESAARDLKSRGVMVYQFRTGSDGMMYPSVCGAGTGATVELEIGRSDLPKAERLGYKRKTSEN